MAGQTEAQVDEAIRREYTRGNVFMRVLLSVLKVESAPPGAADLPDVPVGPVPEPLARWLEEVQRVRPD